MVTFFSPSSRISLLSSSQSLKAANGDCRPSVTVEQLRRGSLSTVRVNARTDDAREVDRSRVTYSISSTYLNPAHLCHDTHLIGTLLALHYYVRRRDPGPVKRNGLSPPRRARSEPPRTECPSGSREHSSRQAARWDWPNPSLNPPSTFLPAPRRFPTPIIPRAAVRPRVSPRVVKRERPSGAVDDSRRPFVALDGEGPIWQAQKHGHSGPSPRPQRV